MYLMKHSKKLELLCQNGLVSQPGDKEDVLETYRVINKNNGVDERIIFPSKGC
jgi:hypothetical protein